MRLQLIWLLFFLSGACGLIYEVLWARHLGLILGNTTHSLAAVLSAFMGGLALGSFLAGRFVSRRSPGARPSLLALYGYLEIAIGAYCLTLPSLFEFAAPLFASLYGEAGGALLGPVRFVVVFLLLLVPTTFMGATLPLLAQFLVASPSGLSRTAGALYAVNTFGAVAGAAGAGFFLLPELGRSATNWTAVAGNLGLGVLALLLARKYPEAVRPVDPPAEAEHEHTPAATAADEPASPKLVRLVAIAFGITGFAAMATQIGWTRALTLAMGSSTYAFSLIVAVFILGLALGGAWGARVASRVKDPATTLSHVLLTIGLLCTTLSVILGWGPTLFFWLIAWGSQWSFTALLAFQALGVAALLVFPTFLMGVTLPLSLQVVRASAGQPGGAGRIVGSLYAINTFGSILGSLMGGLVLLPLLQIQRALQAGAWLYALPGLAIFAASASRDSARARVAIGVLTGGMAILCFARPWDPFEMASGAYLMRQPEKVELARAGKLFEAIPDRPGHEVLYYREGTSATVSVLRTKVGITLAVGGKPDASSGRNDMTTQVGLTLIPGLLHERGPETVLVIGMGSGISLGAALALPSVQRADVVEISPEVMEASYHFSEWSRLNYEQRAGRWALAEPRAEAIINDGRNHLRLTSRRYDLISSEPSNPWIAGIGNLFTKEAFELARARLREGGIFCQWLHRYGMGKDEFHSVMATFAAVFPHAQVWGVLPGGDYILIGSETPLRVRPETLARRMRPEPVQAFLKPIHFDDLHEFLACFMCDGERMQEIAGAALMHTDDNTLLEFAAPRTMHQHARFPIAPWRVSAERILDLEGLADPKAFLRAQDLSVAGRICLDRAKEAPPHLFSPYYAVALELAPRAIWAITERENVREKMLTSMQAGDPLHLPVPDALPSADLDSLIELLGSGHGRTFDPRKHAQFLAEYLEHRARRRIWQGRFDDARKDVVAAARALPERHQTALALATLEAREGNLDKALRAADRAESLGAPAHRVFEASARAYLQERKYEDCARYLAERLGRSGARQAEFGELRGLMGEALLRMGRRSDVQTVLNDGYALNPLAPAVHKARAELVLEARDVDARDQAADASDLFSRFFHPYDVGSWLAWGELELGVARLYEQAQDAGEALEHRRHARWAAHAAIHLAPENEEAARLLARVLKALGEQENGGE